MKLHEFYRKFCNTRLSDRTKDIGGITLLDIYKELNAGVIKNREEELLRLAEIYYHV